MERRSSLSWRSQFVLFITYVACIYVAVVELRQTMNRRLRRAKVMNVVTDKSYFLSFHNYSIHHNVIAPRTTAFNRISQVIAISADFLEENGLEEKVENWNAPISLSVMLTRPQQYSCVVKQIKQLSNSNSLVKTHLRVHLIFPSEWSKKISLPIEPVNCEQSEKTGPQELGSIPINLAKDVARMFCSTKYVLIADFDQLFSTDFEKEVLRTAQQSMDTSKQRVLVYRSFEIDEVMEYPRTKADLQILFSSNAAVVADGQYYTDTQNISTIEEWFAAKPSDSGILSRNMKYLNLSWRPHFVALADIPIHDESFPYELRDDIVLGLEVCRAGYHFDLLVDHFMFHRGFRNESYRNSSASDKRDTASLTSIMSAFRERMMAQYPNTQEDCPDLEQIMYFNYSNKSSKT